MFALFFSLYYSMLAGNWINFSRAQINTAIQPILDSVGEFITSIFGEFQVTDFGFIMTRNIVIAEGITVTPYWILMAFILATITSIGIVAMAVKGVKKAFGIFFMGLR